MSLASPASAQQLSLRIPYAGYPADQRLALGGEAVVPPEEAAMDEAIRAEVLRVRKTQDYVPRPAIWKIADADTTIYLFGTIHSLPYGFRWRNPELEAVIAQADLLLLESLADENAEVDFAQGATRDGSDLPPLLDRVSHRYRGQLAALQRSLPDEMVARLDAMPTWLAAIGIGTLRDMESGEIETLGADDWLERHFNAVGRPVAAIEDSQQVVVNLNGVSERAQRRMLEAALAAPVQPLATLEMPAHAWARGEVGPDSPLIIQSDGLDQSFALATPLLDDRNLAWTEDLIQRLDESSGVILFAAGASHFVGRGSVIELLEARGITVERVQ
ncbi:TraB/GumN family protein [Stakelama tenebrarum]|uniref:TraB/GumN family protein n=1 Tax=Stakelama tenebrarum TaxID=2711215 RepID=A0A6G6Y344_9SPHN|nr:TraB/GumN family protein [Sphingosinithalassobacter tenebrarum]QIG79138.1 TraB/GumN family protein [Sphingosinithalassobacter tenebrarum]